MHIYTRMLSSFALIGTTCLIAGCAASRLEPQVSGYACCNLRANHGWISSNNVQGGDLIPLGEAIKLSSIKRQYYVYGTVGEQEFGFRDDSAKTQAETLQWVRRIVVAEDPRAKMSEWPVAVRAAIGAARVFVGMTREQVAMALGYPSPNDTRDLSAAMWRYWTPAEDLPVDLQFGDDGKLVALVGKMSAVRTLELQR